MIIVYDYKIIQKGDCYYVKTVSRSICQQCKSPLRVRGSKRRYLITETGEKKCFQLRQLYCEKCQKTQIECPSIIVPYKHYSASAIKNAVSNQNAECSAENSTIQRWKSECKIKNPKQK